MKQLLFLLLFPCLAMAQYQGNGNQKITLGEQTSADGLIYRGVANLDTVTATSKITRANKLDTSAYLLLDTVTNLLWHYKIGSNAWTQAGGSTLDTATMLLPYWRSGRFSGVLPVANGGTGSPTQNFVDLTTTQSIAGEKTFTNSTITVSNSAGAGFANFGSANSRAQYQYNNFGGRNAGEYGWQFGRSASNGFLPDAYFIYNIRKNNVALGIDTNSNVGIGTNFNMPTERLHVVGNARISGLANAANPVNVQVDVNGVLVRTSSIDIKEDVQSLPYGLNEVMLLQPSKFSYIDKYKYGEGYDIGFIAQDVNNVIPEAVGTGIESDIFMDSVKLIPVLTKAIQEQQALIKALEQRILTLENK